MQVQLSKDPPYRSVYVEWNLYNWLDFSFADCVSLTVQDRGESFGAQLQADRSGKTFGPYKSLLATSWSDPVHLRVCWKSVMVALQLWRLRICGISSDGVIARHNDQAMHPQCALCNLCASFRCGNSQVSCFPGATGRCLQPWKQHPAARDALVERVQSLVKCNQVWGLFPCHPTRPLLWEGDIVESAEHSIFGHLETCNSRSYGVPRSMKLRVKPATWCLPSSHRTGTMLLQSHSDISVHIAHLGRAVSSTQESSQLLIRRSFTGNVAPSVKIWSLIWTWTPF